MLAQVAPLAEGGGAGLYGVRRTDAVFRLVQQFARAMRTCCALLRPPCCWQLSC